MSEVPSAQADAIKDFTDAYQVMKLSTLVALLSLLESPVVLGCASKARGNDVTNGIHPCSRWGPYPCMCLMRSAMNSLSDFCPVDYAFYQRLYGQQQDHLVSYQRNSERQTKQKVTIKLSSWMLETRHTISKLRMSRPQIRSSLESGMS
jgi:hypothetical protein